MAADLNPLQIQRGDLVRLRGSKLWVKVARVDNDGLFSIEQRPNTGDGRFLLSWIEELRPVETKS